MTSENDDDGYPYNKLRAVIFEAYHVLATDPNGAVKALSEYERRQISLRTIDEILEWRPLIQFSAAHLELLELLFAYWRELEIEGNPRPPEPDGPEGVMSVWQGYLPPGPDVVSCYRRAGPDAD